MPSNGTTGILCWTIERKKKNAAEPMTGLDPDAMDKMKGGVFYLSNFADAKEETPNGQTAYHTGQLTKEETRHLWLPRL